MRKVKVPANEPDFSTADMKSLFELYRHLRDVYNEAVGEMMWLKEKVRELENHRLKIK